MRTVGIFGATGSVGASTIDVVTAHPELYAVDAVTAHSSAAPLAAAARRTGARLAVVGDEGAYPALKEALAGSGIEAAAGRAALLDAAGESRDVMVAAIVGMAGLEPALKALERGTDVAIANKEPLVAAGRLVREAARESGARLLPLDSEHNAVFQVFEPRNRAAVERIVLTASGGPFRTWTKAQMEAATPAQAVAHPNWSMGAKISVDSATMMNKALEVIEAHVLFDMPAEAIDVLVHPQSIVHSMVCYTDGSVLAQLGAPDMRTPIASALGWPERISTPGRKLDPMALATLEFHAPDRRLFPALDLAYRCLAEGAAACLTLNAANEICVRAFLDRRIGFTDIARVAAEILDGTPGGSTETLEEILFLDQSVRERTELYIQNDIPRKVG